MNILVVGAGVFGTTAALELRRRGHEVRLVDVLQPRDDDSPSRDISKMVRLDYGADETYVALMEEALRRWRAWNEAWRAAGRPPLFHEDGLLVLTTEPLRPGSFEGDSFALLVRRGHPLQRLDRAALVARHPLWRHAPALDGYENPQGGWAEAARVTQWLADEARLAGVDVRTGLHVTRVDARSATALGADGAPVDLAADLVVLATGERTAALLSRDALPLRRVGQTVLYFRPARPADFAAPALRPFTADITRTGWYGFPVWDGLVKLGNHGAGTELPDDGLPGEPAPDAERGAREFLRAWLPSLADAPLARARLCPYDDTPDGHFLIDEHPRRPGLWIAAGGSGHAFKFAPVLGELIADAVLRRAGSPHAAVLARCRWRTAAGTCGDAARARSA